MENPHSFLVQCLSGRRGFIVNGKDSYEDVTYAAELVRKAVHLIRDPFDNVVSRFHLEHHAFRKANDTQKLKLFPSTREGFRAFCRSLDKRFGVEEARSRLIDAKVYKTMKVVPCHADFFRYVQWHNLAFVTVQDLGVPLYIVHYEKYDSQYNTTATDLLKFLELEMNGELIEFIRGKQYKKYFTAQEIEVVKAAMQEMSLTVAWENLHHYFLD